MYVKKKICIYVPHYLQSTTQIENKEKSHLTASREKKNLCKILIMVVNKVECQSPFDIHDGKDWI